jgi:hypothetical protein
MPTINPFKKEKESFDKTATCENLSKIGRRT